MVSSGVKIFEKNSQSTREMSGAEYRLSQDGAAMFEPFMTKRKVTLTGEEMAKFIHGGTFRVRCCPFFPWFQRRFRRAISAIVLLFCFARPIITCLIHATP